VKFKRGCRVPARSQEENAILKSHGYFASAPNPVAFQFGQRLG